MTKWHRVSRQLRCPICGKPDWCCYVGPNHGPTIVLCMRIESDKPSTNGGWIHGLRDSISDWRGKPRLISLRTNEAIELTNIAESCSRAANDESVRAFADSLGLTAESLRRLNVGWSCERLAWTFPMHDSTGKVTGIRLRKPDGSKYSVRGGREGLFVPSEIESAELLFVCEGPTDTAAMLDLGVNAVGRPSCSGGVTQLVKYVRQHKHRDVVAAADPDEPGQRGAEHLCSTLLPYVKTVRIITPPHGIKDFRQWRIEKATSTELGNLIDAANARRLKTTVQGA